MPGIKDISYRLIFNQWAFCPAHDLSISGYVPTLLCRGAVFISRVCMKVLCLLRRNYQFFMNYSYLLSAVLRSAAGYIDMNLPLDKSLNLILLSLFILNLSDVVQANKHFVRQPSPRSQTTISTMFFPPA